MVVWISRKRAGHVTDPPVSRALSSLQWLIVKFVDIGMQRVHRVRSAELYVPATTGHTKTENQKALHYMQSDFRCSPTMNITEIFALLRLCLAKIDSYRRFGTTYHPRKTEDLIYTAAEVWSLSRNIIIRKNHAVNVRKLQVHVTVHH